MFALLTTSHVYPFKTLNRSLTAVWRWGVLENVFLWTYVFHWTMMLCLCMYIWHLHLCYSYCSALYQLSLCVWDACTGMASYTMTKSRLWLWKTEGSLLCIPLERLVLGFAGRGHLCLRKGHFNLLVPWWPCKTESLTISTSGHLQTRELWEGVLPPSPPPVSVPLKWQFMSLTVPLPLSLTQACFIVPA